MRLTACYCGGPLLAEHALDRVRCRQCGWILDRLTIIEGVWAVRHSYERHEKRQRDPLNVLPAHYEDLKCQS